MGNACGVSPVNQLVTLGGKRQSKKLKTRPFKVKAKTEETTKQQEKRNDVVIQEKKSDEVRTSKNLQKTEISNSVNDSSTVNNISSTSRCQNQHFNQQDPYNTNRNDETPGYTESLNHEAIFNNKGSPSKETQNSNSKALENSQQKRRRDFLCRKLRECSSSDFDSSVSSPQPGLFLSSKHLIKAKLKTDWQRDEKRLQMEYHKAEQQIKNSQRDELRAKAEAQTWRDKLQLLTVEHRKSLFKQAQTLHSRLHNAEKLLTYHEVRAKKLQMKNDNMKDLINSVKEEAKNLRIESEKRREVTQKMFDEKFFTVEKQLTKLKERLSLPKVENCSKISSASSCILASNSEINQNQLVNDADCKSYINYSRYFQSPQSSSGNSHPFYHPTPRPPKEMKYYSTNSSSGSSTPLISNVPRRKWKQTEMKTSSKICCQPQKQFYKQNNASPQTSSNGSSWQAKRNHSTSKFQFPPYSQSPKDLLQVPKNAQGLRSYGNVNPLNTSIKSRETKISGQSTCARHSTSSIHRDAKNKLNSYSSATRSINCSPGSNSNENYPYSGHSRNTGRSTNSVNDDVFYSSAGSSILLTLFKQDSQCESHSVKFINK